MQNNFVPPPRPPPSSSSSSAPGKAPFQHPLQGTPTIPGRAVASSPSGAAPLRHPTKDDTTSHPLSSSAIVAPPSLPSATGAVVRVPVSGTVVAPPASVRAGVVREASPQPQPLATGTPQRSAGVSVSPAPVRAGPSTLASSLHTQRTPAPTTAGPPASRNVSNHKTPSDETYRNTTGTTSSSSGSTAAAAAVAAVGPVMLSHPLVMQATVLRNPDWYEQSQIPELVEPGDILYDVLRVPQLAFEGEEAFTNGLSNRTHRKHKKRSEDREEKNATEAAPPALSSSPAATSASISFNAPVAPTPTFGVQPLLALPDKVGVYVTKESFKALLCFQNSATYPLSRLRFRVDVVAPLTPSQANAQQQQQIPIHKVDLPTLAPKANYAFPIEVPLPVVGTYTLSVHVYYTDPSQTDRKLSWASSFPVEQAITEAAQRVLRRVPLPRHPQSRDEPHDKDDPIQKPKDLYEVIFQPQRAESSHGTLKSGEETVAASSSAAAAEAARRLTIEDAVQDPRLPRHSYALTVGLRNTCAVPVALTDVRLALPAGSPLVVFETEPSLALPSTTDGDVKNGLRRLASATHPWPRANFDPQGHHMQPGEQRHFTFRFLIDPAALRGGDGPRTPLGPALAPGLGCVAWQWRRANGDGGSEQSSVLRLDRIRATPEMELLVARVSASSDADGSGGGGEGGGGGVAAAAAAVSAPLRAGRPLEVRLTLLYTPNTARQHGASASPAAPVIAVEHASSSSLPTLDSLDSPAANSAVVLTGTPRAARTGGAAWLDVSLKVRPEKLAPYFLYSGPALRPLGFLEPGVPLSVTLLLLPWQSGLLPLVKDALQIVDARAPDVILWPPAPAEGPTTASPSSGSSSFGARTASYVGVKANSDGHRSAALTRDSAMLPAHTRSSVFADRFLVSATLGSVVTGGGGGGIGSSSRQSLDRMAAHNESEVTATPTGKVCRALVGGSGTAPAVAGAPLRVVEDEMSAEDAARTLCDILVQ